ncbi:LOG family protein [Streptomyces sp. NPDC127051]|uniref:LOG family protein n=1 Tax=Streptomyces sp. NPDC127051 TaxID=3347119 RepID=UPI003669C691
MQNRTRGKHFIGVLCDANGRGGGKYVEAAKEVGRQLGTAGYGVVYNAGTGPMGNALASAAMHTGSPVVGVIPRRTMNELLEGRSAGLPIGTLHVVETQVDNARVLQSFSTAYVALPGGFEILESILHVVGRADSRPLILVNIDQFFSGLISQLERCISSGFSRRSTVNILKVAHDVSEMSGIIQRELAGAK